MLGSDLPRPDRAPLWQEQAACRGEDPDLFFPEKGETAQAARAKAVCEGCPVRSDCLDYAIATVQMFGVWGGMTQRQLARERQRRLRVARLEAAS